MRGTTASLPHAVPALVDARFVVGIASGAWLVAGLWTWRITAVARMSGTLVALSLPLAARHSAGAVAGDS